MKYYFRLQYTRLNRWLTDIGLHPLLGCILAPILFAILSALLFYKTEYASWIYVIIIVSILYKLSSAKRNDKLRNTFVSSDYKWVRIIENSLVSFPFLIYLLVEKEFIAACVIILLVIAFVFIKTNQQWSKTIPTPFKKFPFEFIVGFRKLFWVIFIAYFLIVMAIQVDNYNLGLFGLGVIFLTGMFFYQQPESEYFVWIHSYRTQSFLAKKFITAVICITILSILALIGVVISFTESWMTTVLVYLGGYVFLGSMIVAKYSAYPHEMNVPQGMFYIVSMMFPPLLIIAIWIFYSQSKRRLQHILEC